MRERVDKFRNIHIPPEYGVAFSSVTGQQLEWQTETKRGMMLSEYIIYLAFGY
jgi:hypothetical protein